MRRRTNLIWWFHRFSFVLNNEPLESSRETELRKFFNQTCFNGFSTRLYFTVNLFFLVNHAVKVLRVLIAFIGIERHWKGFIFDKKHLFEHFPDDFSFLPFSSWHFRELSSFNFRWRLNLLLDVSRGYEASLMNWLLRMTLRGASPGVANGCWRLSVNMMMNDVNLEHLSKKKLRINQFWQKLYHWSGTRSKRQFIWMMLRLEVHLARDLWESFALFILELEL